MSDFRFWAWMIALPLGFVLLAVGLLWAVLR